MDDEIQKVTTPQLSPSGEAIIEARLERHLVEQLISDTACSDILAFEDDNSDQLKYHGYVVVMARTEKDWKRLAKLMLLDKKHRAGQVVDADFLIDLFEK
jgi:hypothetical protein